MGWHFWIDRGGTFTDVVAKKPDGSLVTHKLLSEHPDRYDDAAIQAIRDLMALAPDQAIPADAIEVVKMGTTVATNALLEHKGAKTLLLITKGFSDLLEIGDQHRPDLFALAIKKSLTLYDVAMEVEERLAANGEVLTPLNIGKARQDLESAYQNGFRSVAIVCLHAYQYPQHEQQLAHLATEIGFTQVSTSHKTSALIKVVQRGYTTVADAYLSPVLRHYVHQVADQLKDVPLWFMQSHGGLAAAEHFEGKDSVLSGPAGGIVGAVKVCEAAGFEKVITFDMGGTSTDVAHYRGAYERSYEKLVAGTRLYAPMMDIHTVAAGGGSIINFHGNRMVVGPDSAGAVPGPCCYGRGGPLTVTDANLMLGRLIPESFPKTFGQSGTEALSRERVKKVFAQQATWLKTTHQTDYSPESLAEGALEIAVQNMARAIKTISIRQGYNPADYALCVFGGAAGQLACAVANALSMKQIFIHPFSGVLSAFGMGLAEARLLKQQTLEQACSAEGLHLAHQLAEKLTIAGTKQLAEQQVEVEQANQRLGIRYQGSDQILEVPFGEKETVIHAFELAHEGRFGFRSPETPLVVAKVLVELVGPQQRERGTGSAFESAQGPELPKQTQLWVDGEFQAVPLFQWEALANGQEIMGPAMVVSHHATVVVERGWVAKHKGHLVLESLCDAEKKHFDDCEMDPVRLEIFNSAFMSIAEQMGFTLQNTAASVNMKERLDFSCALFDAEGHLIANAPHMPVHLGSMGESVQSLIDAHGESLKPGQIYASNNPYKGGTHLPDITVIMPVFDEFQQRLAFLAARGHHADVGGMTPGSMPPFSKSLCDEGALLDNVLILDHGVFQEATLLEALETGPYPARNPQNNLADLKAQIAALRKGEQELRALMERNSKNAVLAYMNHVQDYAEASVKRVLSTLKSGKFSYELDHGCVVNVSVAVDQVKQTAIVDFSGTSAQQHNNFNAPSAVCKAAVLYVFRSLINEDIPLNAGCLRPLSIVIPKGSMLAPEEPAAVVAGNVETSQVITDALYGALGLLASAQGTMNNFTFGNETYQYYETIAGGSGAGEGFDGVDGVQTHMTNSRITDPEILETRFPVVLECFGIREGSGGEGAFRGGCGLVRRFQFRQPMRAAILANRRKVPPFGLNGGGSGLPGMETVMPVAGDPFSLNGLGEVDLNPGDRLEIKTPGGGGFGNKNDTLKT